MQMNDAEIRHWMCRLISKGARLPKEQAMEALKDLQQARQDLRELCQEILDIDPANRSKLQSIRQEYGWED